MTGVVEDDDDLVNVKSWNCGSKSAQKKNFDGYLVYDDKRKEVCTVGKLTGGILKEKKERKWATGVRDDTTTTTAIFPGIYMYIFHTHQST